MFLELDTLNAGYGGVPIVRDVSLALNQGEVLGVVGRNGVGKTTLVKTIAGLLRVTGGGIRYKGEDVTSRDARDMARLGMGYVPQGRGIFPRLSVIENLRMGEAVGGGRRAPSHYEEVFAWFPRLKERARQQAGTLSGGEQQMLAIGRVLIGSPDFLLLDEPSEGIQPSIVQQIAEVILEQNEARGLTVLLVEQNLDLVYMTAERCVVMDKGALVAELTPEQLAEPETARRYLAI
ncbi:MAG: ABC transporter ATP-binding protein [Alphaproteobacteria bacterium]